MVNRFQIKLTGNDIMIAHNAGRIVGWRFEFFSCQPAAISLLVGENEVPVAEGLFIPAKSSLRLKFAGDSEATASALLVLEAV